MYRPLEGITVVDLTTAGAGPSCTKILREYGARDILIEPLSGNSSRGIFKEDFYNTGKESLTLDLKTPEGISVMLALIEKADVFVSNYRPGALRRLGLTYEKLSGLNPGLIYATLTGFGEEGPDADHPGYDCVAFWARGGLLRDASEPGTLIVPPVAVGDIATGQALAGGICAALFQRERTGKGDKVFTSLLAEAVYLNHDAIVQTQYGDEYPKSRKNPRRSLMNTYQCKDGEWLSMAVFDFERYWDKILTVTGRTDLIGDPRWRCYEDTTYEKSAEVVALLDEALAKMNRDEALAAFRSIDLPCEPVGSSKDVIFNKQCRDNNYIFDIHASDGKYLSIPANPVKLTDKDCGVVDFKNGPRLGADSKRILLEMGLDEATVEDYEKRHITSFYKE